MAKRRNKLQANPLNKQDHPMIVEDAEGTVLLADGRELPASTFWDLCQSRHWRLRNLYVINTKSGVNLIFKPNRSQNKILNGLHGRNIIPKSRQQGVTTLFCIYFLDAILFEPNIYAGVCAHTKDDAKKFFRNKIKFAYDNLPAELKAVRPLVKEADGELVVGHTELPNTTSSISVSVGFRSGTYQYLLISEYGPLWNLHPLKAADVKEGSTNAVPATGTLIIESTAAGDNDFKTMCVGAKNLSDSGRRHTSLEYKLCFLPWWDDPDCCIGNEEDIKIIPIPQRLLDYFQNLESEHKVPSLSAGQRAWYVVKEREQGDSMHSQFPSFLEEAFEVSVEGAFYSRQITEAYKGQRIGKFPHDPQYQVFTAWDLGIGDPTAVWFAQSIQGQIRLIDYREWTDLSIPEIYREMFNIQTELRYNFSMHLGPHDLAKREMGSGKSIMEMFKQQGIVFSVVANVGIMSGIQAVKGMFPVCCFDEEKCELGLSRLKGYQRRWNQSLGHHIDEPKHDDNSHGSDAFRMLAVGYGSVSNAPASMTGNTTTVDRGYDINQFIKGGYV